MVAIFTCQAEYIAACQAVWPRRLISDPFAMDPTAHTMLVGNKSVIQLCKNPVFHDVSKHIDVQYYFNTERIEGAKSS